MDPKLYELIKKENIEAELVSNLLRSGGDAKDVSKATNISEDTINNIINAKSNANYII